MNFQAIAFVDSSLATAGYVKQFRSRLQGDTIALRSEGKDRPVLQEWKSARQLISKVSSAAAPLLGGKPAVIRMARILTLAPDERVDWEYMETDGIRAYLPMLPSPGAMLFSGTEAHNPPVGQLTVINRVPPFSALNLGPVPATWLVVDAEIPVGEAGPPAG